MKPVDCYRLGEWQELFLPGCQLSAQDQELARQLGGEAGRVDIDELRSGLRVRARSWVGVVRFNAFELHILPKMAGGNLRLVEMLAFTSGLDALRRNQSLRQIQADSQGGLFDLFAWLLAEACERLLNGGLLYDYVVHEGDLPVMRGRLLVEAQIRRRLGQVDRLECRYDEHSTDILETQILSAALQVCARQVSHPGVSRQVRRLSAIFHELCSTAVLDLRSARPLIYHRLNQHYAEPHHLAWLILDALRIDDLFASGQTRSFAFLLDMNRLFEQFTQRFVEWALRGSGYLVYPQHRDRSILWDITHQQSYARAIPDLLLENPAAHTRLAVDAKYKQYDQRPVTTADLYQVLLYAYAYQPRAAHPHAILLYPTIADTDLVSAIQVRSEAQWSGANAQIAGINIGEALDEVRSQKAGRAASLIRELVCDALGVI